MAKVIIVNVDDVAIGLKTYKELGYEDIYRVTALWLTDLNNKYCLITQRKWDKLNDPGRWMMAVSGTVEEGEDYDTNMSLEIEEEIGLKGVKIIKAAKSFVDDGKHKFFVQFFKAQVPMDKTDITIQEEEVEQYKWVTIKDLIINVIESPERYVPSMKASLEALGIE